MKKYISLFTALICTCVWADQTPQLPVDADPDDMTITTPAYYETSPTPPKEKANYTSLYVFLGTLVAATAGLLISTNNTGRHATPAEKSSATGDVPAPTS